MTAHVEMLSVCEGGTCTYLQQIPSRYGFSLSLARSWSEIILLSGTGASFLLASSSEARRGFFCY
jgi:hypothetical protein